MPGPRAEEARKCTVAVHLQHTAVIELELELIQTHMTQKPMLRLEVGTCRVAQKNKHSEKVIKFPSIETFLNAKVPPPWRVVSAGPVGRT